MSKVKICETRSEIVIIVTTSHKKCCSSAISRIEKYILLKIILNNPVNTMTLFGRLNVYKRQMDVETMLCAYWEDQVFDNFLRNLKCIYSFEINSTKSGVKLLSRN